MYNLPSVTVFLSLSLSLLGPFLAFFFFFYISPLLSTLSGFNHKYNFQRKLRIEISLWHQISRWFAVVFVCKIYNKIIINHFSSVFSQIYIWGHDSCAVELLWSFEHLHSHELTWINNLFICLNVRAAVHLISNAENYYYSFHSHNTSNGFQYNLIIKSAEIRSSFRTFEDWLAISMQEDPHSSISHKCEIENIFSLSIARWASNQWMF